MKREAEQTLAVIGAGPKGLAIAAKAKTLKEAGLLVPRLLVIDKYEVAASWSGKFGFTDGSHPLGTPPEKDVGFPYDSICWQEKSDDINDAMRAYSWAAFLVGTKGYSRWVDKGRPQPLHPVWAEYLKWVAGRSSLNLLIGEVTEISVENECWSLKYLRSDSSEADQPLIADGLVITGAIAATPIPMNPRTHRRVVNGSNFWQSRAQFEELQAGSTIAVIGPGETAAAIVVALLELVDESIPIHIITPHGFLYSRGEGFHENRIYTNPHPEWTTLSETHRREFIDRTDRGVFSVEAQRQIATADNVFPVAGRATRINVEDERVRVGLRYGEDAQETEAPYDFVVVATGLEPDWFLKLMSETAKRTLMDSVSGTEDSLRAALERGIDSDLSVENHVPKLHLPMLAAFRQGPGFPNLSALGLLSDRILEPYVVQ